MGIPIQSWQMTLIRESSHHNTYSLLQGAISWRSKLQKVVVLSTTEAEYIVATESIEEFLWMKNLLKELSIKQKKFSLYCDSQIAINLSKNATYHSRTKHIDVHYHWIRDALENHLMQIVKNDTSRNRQIWWWNLYQRRSMSSARVWQTWFQLEDHSSSWGWRGRLMRMSSHVMKRLFIYHMHSWMILRLPHTFMHGFDFPIN